MPSQVQYDYDFVIIGSGFGGSVSALRLAEKGYKVAVIEVGKRYTPAQFAKTNWNLKRALWLPKLLCHGIMRINLFKHVMVLSGCGVGGGSLVYAATLLQPPDNVWQNGSWAKLNNWGQALQPHYQTARRYLGVNKVPFRSNVDDILHQVAQQHGMADKFYQTDVGIYFGSSQDDPYFAGKGPKRQGCSQCGSCMIGCRDGGKNSLDKNYLYLAEQLGVTIIAENQVVDINPLAEGKQGYQLWTKSSTQLLSPNKREFTTKGLVIAAGTLGTMKLLLKLKQNKRLSKLSDKLGQNILTNSESIIGIRKYDKHIDYSKGIAIGSGCYIDNDTHVEVVRYPKNSDSMGLLSTIMPSVRGVNNRALQWLITILRHPIKTLKTANPFGFARSTIILLVMQTTDNPLRLQYKRSWLWPFKHLRSTGAKIPAFIPQANDFANKIAKFVGGEASTTLPEILLNQPITAHILGGCAMGANEQEGVIDQYNRVYNYPNMYVCDGSMISANLGVNPSLSITAITEHAMNHIPDKYQNPHFA